MRTRIAAAALLLSLTAGLAGAADGDVEREAIKKLMLHKGPLHSSTDDYLKSVNPNEVLESHLYESAILSGMNPAPGAEITRMLTDARVVLPNGEMATTTYHELMLQVLQGNMLLTSGKLDEWRKSLPDSSHPIIYIASNRLSVAAEEARNDFRIHRPKTDQVEIDAKELESIRGFLVENRSVGARDPYWYILMVEVSVLQGRGETEIKELVADGLRAFPENIRLPVMASAMYHSRWKGDIAKLAAYADWVSNLPGFGARKDIHARIYAHAYQGQYGLTLFKLAPTNWPRLPESITHLVKTYPNAEHTNLAAILACLAGDRPLTRELLKHKDVGSMRMLWPDPQAHGYCLNWAS